jgi:hypothetical protein
MITMMRTVVVVEQSKTTLRKHRFGSDSEHCQGQAQGQRSFSKVNFWLGRARDDRSDGKVELVSFIFKLQTSVNKVQSVTWVNMK